MSDVTQTPAAVGSKFHPDGSPQRFPGTSVVCALTADQPQHALLLELQRHASGLCFGSKLRPLPPASFHMTVFDLLCDEVRDPGRWAKGLPMDAPLSQTDRYVENHLRGLEPWPEAPRMRFAELGPMGVTLHILLEAADDPTAAMLASFREAVSAATGIRHPDHDRYRFHISLAYRMDVFDQRDRAQLDSMTAELNPRFAREFGTLTLGRPELVFFDDMFAFPTTRRR